MFQIHFVVAFSAFIAICGANSGATFPENPKPCKYGDAECIGQIINWFAKEKYTGDPSIGIRSIDPLEIKKLHISRGDDSPVRIDLKFANGICSGLKTSKFKSSKGFGKDISGQHEITVRADYVELLSDYNITGQVLILPIRGQGKSNLTLIDVDITFGWHGEPDVKNDNTYMKLDKFYVNIVPKHVKYGFENLFNDKALSDNMNKFLEENSDDVYPEIQSSLNRGMAPITRNIMKDLFAKFPYDKLFAN